MSDLRRETREDWGARPPTNRRYDVDPHGVAIHYPGAASTFRAMPHTSHQQLMRDWQQQHMGRGSNDLEYGSVVCPCGIWMEGRTEWDDPMVRVGSNGTAAANTTHTSVQMMLGTGEAITDTECRWLGEAVAQLRAWGWGTDVKGHRDFYATACPGDSIYQALPTIAAYADHPPAPAATRRPRMFVARSEDSQTQYLLSFHGSVGLVTAGDSGEVRKALADPMHIAVVTQQTMSKLLDAAG